MKMIVIYDDTNEKSEVIRDIIGNKGFADVVVKKQKLESYYQEKCIPNCSGLRYVLCLNYMKCGKKRNYFQMNKREFCIAFPII